MKLSSEKISSYTKSCSNGFSFDEIVVNKISRWNNMQVEWLYTAEVFKIFPNINSKTK